MASEKQRRKARRRAEELMAEAWEALARERFSQAERQSQLAIGEGFVNPRLWNDRGQILLACGKPTAAAAAFRRAIALAPGFADAAASLAQLEPAVPNAEPASEEPPEGAPLLTARGDRYDWSAIASETQSEGVALLPELISALECSDLLEVWAEARTLGRELRVADEERGSFSYCSAPAPLPPLIAELRAEMYARLVPAANRIETALGRPACFPRTHARFVEHCARAGQHRAMALFLHCAANGLVGLHRNPGGAVEFPFGLLLTLDAEPDLQGGQFLLADERHGKLRVRQRIATNVGDGLVFAARERLVELGGALGAQPVLHGIAQTSAARTVLSISFHDA